MNVKFRVDRGRLVAALAGLAKVAPTKKTARKAVLRNARFCCDRGVLTVEATDTDSAAVFYLDALELAAQPPEPIAGLVDLSQFHRLARETARTPSIAVQFPAAGGLRVDGLGTLETKPDNEFPDFTLDNWQPAAAFTCNAAALAAAIRAVEFATDTDSSRYALGGIRLEFIGRPDQAAQLNLIATDGRRLAIARVAAGLTVGEELAAELTRAAESEWFTLPAKAAAAILAALSQKGGGDRVAIVEIVEQAAADDSPAQRRLRVTIADRAGNVIAVFGSRELEGRFPKWRDVLPADSDTGGTIAADGKAVDALRTAARLSCDENRGATVIFRGGRGFVIYRNRARGVRFCGWFNASTSPPPGCRGESRRLTIESRYFGDWLAATEQAAAGFACGWLFRQPRADGPIVLKTGCGGFEYVIMPLAKQ